MTDPGTRRGPSLTGAYNFRDLAGLRTSDGRRVRSGVLFRSDTLQALTDADVVRLTDELHVGLVVDLRAGLEAVQEGRGPLAAASTCYLNVPLPEAPESDRPPDQQTLLFYLTNLDSAASPLPTLLRTLSAVAGHTPTVLHCAAGKDRTGLVTALLLRLLGVETQEIVTDYLRTAENMDRIVARFRDWPRYREHLERVPPEVYRAEEHTIRGFLERLEVDHGGARAWATSRGLGEDVISRLAAGLLEPIA